MTGGPPDPVSYTFDVSDLRQENARLKELVAETLLENRLLKKSVTGSGSPEDEA